MSHSQKLEIKVGLTIQRPPLEVFEAIANPAKMSGYFIAKGSGRLETGKIIDWTFPEMDTLYPINVEKVVTGEFISYYWGDEKDGSKTLVEITLVPIRDAETQVKITEKSRNNDDAGLKWLKENTEGWANFLCCLKGYVEYGINLRKGAFEKNDIK